MMFAATTTLMHNAMRIARIFVVVGFAAAACTAGGTLSSAADSKKYPGLADGLEVLSAYSTLHPKAKEAFDKILSRAPPEVRQKVEASDWAARQRRMTPAQLKNAATDGKTSLLPTADGLAAIPTGKLKGAIDGLTDFAIDQKETADFLNSIRDAVPAEHKGSLDAAIQGLRDFNASKGKAPATGLLEKVEERGRELLEDLARKGVATAVFRAASEQARILTDAIRDKVEQDGPARTLDSYRKDAAERKRQIAARAAKQEAQRRQQAEAAAEAKRDAERQRKAVADINGLLDKLDATNARQEAIVGVCERQAAALSNYALPGNLNEAIDRGNFLNRLAEQSILAADRVQAGAQGLKKIIKLVEQAAAAVCANPTATSNPDAIQRLGALRGLARGTRDGIRQQIDDAAASLRRPIGVELSRLIADANQKRAQCQARPKPSPGGSTFGMNDADMQAVLKQPLQVMDATRAIAGLSETSATAIMDSALLTARIDQIDRQNQLLQQQFLSCSQKIKAADRQCERLASGGDVGRLLKQEALLQDLEDRRRAALDRVLIARSEVETDFQNANRATRKAEECVKPPESGKDKAPKPEIAEPKPKPRTRDPNEVADAALAACRRKLQTPRAQARLRDGKWRCFLPTETPHERDALKTCREQYGRGSLPNLTQSSYKTYVCYCITGYEWNANKTYCDRAPTTARTNPGNAPSGGAGQSGRQPGQAGTAPSGIADCGSLAGGYHLKRGHCVGPGDTAGMCPIVPGWVLPTGSTCGDVVARATPSTPGAGASPRTNPAAGPSVPPVATTPSPVRPTSSPGRRTPSNVGTPTSSRRPTSRPPPPTCQNKSCRMVGAQFVNGRWITGHCVCSDLGKR